MHSLHLQQWLGLPLLYIDRGMYDSWQDFVKELTTVLVIGLNQFRAPVVVQFSNDSTVEGQVRKNSSGEVIVKFPSRIVLMANHQVRIWIQSSSQCVLF